MRLSVLSTEYVGFIVKAVINGNLYDPTGDSVSFAFLPLGSNPTSGDWMTGSWGTATAYGAPQYTARVLVGPGTGGHPLPAGDYVTWMKITDSPEVPVRVVGNLTIT
jgi:hypothetical protein